MDFKYIISRPPAAFREVRLDDLDLSDLKPFGGTTVAEEVEDFLESLKDGTHGFRGLYFFGPAGTGKTILSSAVYNEVRDALFPEWDGDKNIVFMAAYDWGQYVRRSVGEDPEAERIVDIIRRVPVLILDDIGKERRSRGSDFIQGEFSNLLRHRYYKGRITIITSNIAPDEVAVNYGATTASFFQEVFQAVPVIDSDQRTRARARAAGRRERRESRRNAS